MAGTFRSRHLSEHEAGAKNGGAKIGWHLSEQDRVRQIGEPSRRGVPGNKILRKTFEIGGGIRAVGTSPCVPFRDFMPMGCQPSGRVGLRDNSSFETNHAATSEGSEIIVLTSRGRNMRLAEGRGGVFRLTKRTRSSVVPIRSPQSTRKPA